MRIAMGLFCIAAVFPLTAQLKSELQSGWAQWLREDVSTIITDDARKAFGQLSTDEEREQFVEQFWLRRDPTPDTVENEFKEEHYRRIAYANEHFASGIPGRKTDRGRIYIRFGPPDEIDSHPSGGSYQRPAGQGGGQTSTYPFEQWRYRHLDNIGEDIVVEFVDATMTSEYRMTTDPCAKDALTNVPGGTPCGTPSGAQSANDNEFSRLELQAKLDRAPALKFKDLEAVSSHISYNTLPMQVQVDYLRVTSFSALANVTLQLENRDLQFLLKDGIGKSTVDVLGQVFTMTGRRVAAFERSLYQESLPLAPGRYKMVVVARDKVSGNMSSYESALDVPRFEDDRPGAGSLILADAFERVPTKSMGGGMFTIGDMKVRPRVSPQFGATEKMGIYLQLYNVPPGGEIAWQIDRAGNGGKALEFAEALPLGSLSPGAYRLRLTVSGAESPIERQADFTVTP